MTDKFTGEVEINHRAKILWDYLRLGQPLRKSDCIIAMGSHDLRVGKYAAHLVLEGWATILVCSGGLGRLTREIWLESEARKFACTAMEAGISEGDILIEERSTNTAENLLFSKEMLAEKGITIHSAILVHKPYMERRVLATAGIVLPDLDCTISSPPIPFEAYPTEDIPLDHVINIMVGDFQRVILYAQKGYQTRQEIPLAAMDAYNFLVKAGFNMYLINE